MGWPITNLYNYILVKYPRPFDVEHQELSIQVTFLRKEEPTMLLIFNFLLYTAFITHSVIKNVYLNTIYVFLNKYKADFYNYTNF